MPMALCEDSCGTVMNSFVKRYRSELVMCAFIVQMLASPLADKHPLIGGVLALLLFGLILTSVSFLANRKIVYFLVLPLSALWLLARTLEALGNDHRMYAQLSPAAGLALSCAILWALLDRFHSTPQETTNVIAEAFVSYLVIAIAFSQIYSLLDRTFSGSFNQVIPPTQSSTLLYFSMITLSSVGYGGILPLNPYVRLVAALESMIGIFYVAVVVARLVSASSRRHSVEGK
jgi:Ion channel